MQTVDKPQPVSQFKAGDRIQGKTSAGREIEGIVTREGRTLLQIDNGWYVSKAEAVVVRSQVIDEDGPLLDLVGRPWSDQIDRLFQEHRLCNLADWSVTTGKTEPVGEYRGWAIAVFRRGDEIREVEVSKNKQTWFVEVQKINDPDAIAYCRRAIDFAEDSLEQLAKLLAGVTDLDEESEVAIADSVDDDDPAPGTLDTTLYAALHHVQNAEKRWEALKAKGATDEALNFAIGWEFGLGAGVYADGCVYYCAAGESKRHPKFWHGGGGPKGKPTLQGKQLIKKVRSLLEIPYPAESGQPEAKDVVASVDTLCFLPLLTPERIKNPPLEPGVELSIGQRVRDLRAKSVNQGEGVVARFEATNTDSLDIWVVIDWDNGQKEKVLACQVQPIEVPEAVLARYGFIDSTAFVCREDIEEEYRGWGIALSIPNGGIVAVDIFRLEGGDQCWGRPTEGEFDYLDREGILAHAKEVIDHVEAAIADNSPQLAIPGIEEAAVVERKSPTPETFEAIEAEYAEAVANTAPGINLSRYLQDDPFGEEAIAQSEGLTSTEQQRLDWLEQVVQQGLNTFIEVGNALVEIRDSKLYRSAYETFEAYCSDKWKLKKSRAYQFIEAAKIADELKASTIVEVLPDNEAQYRELAKVAPGQRAEVLQEAIATAPQGKLTANHIQQVVQNRTEPEVPTLEALHSLYSQVGRIGRPVLPKKSQPNAFTVEREDLGNPFPLHFRDRKEAWGYWQRHSERLLELAKQHPLQPGASCKACQHRHLIGDGREFECGAKGGSWTCEAARDWARENDGCDRFKPFGQVTVAPPVSDKVAPTEPAKEDRLPIYAFDLTRSQYNKLAKHANAAGMSMVGFLQQLVENLSEAV